MENLFNLVNCPVCNNTLTGYEKLFYCCKTCKKLLRIEQYILYIQYTWFILGISNVSSMKNTNTQNKIKDEVTKIFSPVTEFDPTPEVKPNFVKDGSKKIFFLDIVLSKVVKTTHAEGDSISISGWRLEELLKLCQKYKLRINSIDSRNWTWENTFSKNPTKQTTLTTKILVVEK